MTHDTVAIARALEERRRELQDELASLTAVPRDPMAAVSFGKRIGDGTTEAVERLNNVGTANSIAVTLADVERALEKLEDGTYGICDSCGDPVGEERLEAIPSATLCISCARIRSSVRNADAFALRSAAQPVAGASASAARARSARITCIVALISARWVNACGKFPRWRPVRGSSSSA